MNFMSLITVHYRDINSLHRDVKVIPVWKPIGHLFDLNHYEHKISYPYYFSGVAQSTIKYRVHPQDVIICMQPYIKMQILFKDVSNYNHVVASYRPLIRKPSATMDYERLGRRHMPPHYQFLTPIQSSFDSNNDRVATFGGTEIIYVKPSRDANLSTGTNNVGRSTLVNGYVKYVDINDGTLKKQVPIRGNKGMPVNYTRYEKATNLPKGFKFVRLSDLADRELVPNGHYLILVKSLVTRSHAKLHSQVVTGEVLYQDIDQHSIRATQIVTGPQNESIADYTSRNSKYIPKGYHFVKLLSNHGSRLINNAIYIVLISSSGSAYSGNVKFDLSRGINNIHPSNLNDILTKISSSLKDLSVAVGRRK